MLIAEIRAAVNSNCGRNYAVFNANIDRWCNNEVKNKLLLPNDLWFMQDPAYTTIDTVVGQRSYNLPTNFKKARDDGITYRDSAGGNTVLDVLNSPEARKAWTITEPGAPEAIVIGQTTYDVWPLPNDVYHIDWDFTAFLADLSDSKTSNFLSINYPDIYINAGTWKGFEFLEEYERAAYWEAQFMKLRDEILNYNVLRKTGKISLSFSPNAKPIYKNERPEYLA